MSNLYISRSTDGQDAYLLMSDYAVRARIVEYADQVKVAPIGGALNPKEDTLVVEFCAELQFHSDAIAHMNSWTVSTRQQYRDMATERQREHEAVIEDAPIDTPAVVENRYEEAGRLAKVAKIMDFINNAIIGAWKITDDQLRTIDTWDDSIWKLLAGGAGVKMPSKFTQRMVIERVKARLYQAELNRQVAIIAAHNATVIDYAKARPGMRAPWMDKIEALVVPGSISFTLTDEPPEVTHKLKVEHLDGNPKNNELSNLRITTADGAMTVYLASEKENR